jgi:UDP-2,3-diacylglucosamine pyrophosphatase LpxH
MLRTASKLAAALAALLAIVLAAPDTSFRFVLLGDRTGEAQPGIYERVWQQAAADAPAFVASVGDTIEGLNDATAAAQWQEEHSMRRAYQKIPFYLTPGNHDVWSPLSEKLFRQFSGHPLHYSFDYAQAHFTILDNSRSDELSAEEMSFLESDLQSHAAQPVKFILSHRPSWLLSVALANPIFDFQRLAKKYGARYVVAGHIHQMLHMELEGITYISLPSAGGHLRLSGKYEDGWFFGHTLVEVHSTDVQFHIKEIGGRTTRLSDWGALGLIKRVSHQ